MRDPRPSLERHRSIMKPQKKFLCILSTVYCLRPSTRAKQIYRTIKIASNAHFRSSPPTFSATIRKRGVICQLMQHLYLDYQQALSLRPYPPSPKHAPVAPPNDPARFPQLCYTPTILMPFGILAITES